MAYAENTTVPVEKSRAEIEKTLEKYGADQFQYGRDDAQGLVMIQFRAHERNVRFLLTMPDRLDKQFTHHAKGARTADAAYKAWEQACRSKWRSLNLCIKAKLEAVECGITEFEDEFLAHIVLPGGGTAGDFLKPQIAIAYETGKMPKSLLSLPAPK